MQIFEDFKEHEAYLFTPDALCLAMVDNLARRYPLAIRYCVRNARVCVYVCVCERHVIRSV